MKVNPSGSSRLSCSSTTSSRPGAIGTTPAHVRRRRTRRAAVSSRARIEALFGHPASWPRLVRRSPGHARWPRQARPAVLATVLACLLCAALAPTGASAAAPGWHLGINPLPANFAPGQESEYAVLATNVGAEETSGSEIEVKTVVPTTWKISSFNSHITDPGVAKADQPECSVSETLTEHALICTTAAKIRPGYLIRTKVGVTPPPSPEKATLESKATVKGGGAVAEISASSLTAVQSEPIPFDFLSFQAPLTDEEAKAQTLAGAHPYQQTLSLGFPTKNPGDGLTNDGHPRDFYVELPRGMAGSPAATRVLCTEAELTTDSCPVDSQLGVADVTTLGGDVGISDVLTSNLYNMVAPPGSVAELGTNVANIGVFVHSLATVNAEDEYRVQVATRDVIAFGQQPIFGIQAQVWGSPTAEAHDWIRGFCGEVTNTEGKACKPEGPRRDVALLSLATHCPPAAAPAPSIFDLLADTWEEPSPPADLHHAGYGAAELDGTPVSLKDCGSLKFQPTIAARPTTNLTDSPSGLDLTLHQPQDGAFASRSSAALKDTRITFPAGLAVNASQAAGLGACSEAQVGYLGSQGGAPRFDEAPQGCPDAAKIGTIEASSPAVVRRDAKHEVQEQEGEALERPLKGSLYLATPFENPFGGLIAVYLVVEDEATGVIAKLAAKATLDPQSGQITTTVSESPELPLEDVKVHLFGGNRGTLITPPTCTEQTTRAQLTPYSAPEGEVAFPTASFKPAQAPGGGPCPTSEAQLPSAPKLAAGTESPAAAKYSPLLFKLSREDGTQRLGRVEATLPKGLTAKLAGVGTCSEAAIAGARAREKAQAGAAELADPSCPASSQIGIINAAAGAGPTPYYVAGRAYLAGPYKGAPLSVVTITPAVAGPFDLGTVVVRIALYLDPETGVVRAVTDPLPSIIEGVPIDARSLALRAERPAFSLNPTSCSEKSFTGNAVSTLGVAAPISQRFQLGGCKSLPYKPKISTRLFGPIHRGGHPRLRSVFTAKAGEANTARVSFALPKSEFIDQAHFRTICTRVQFAANQCPAGSVYGHVKATSPLLDYAVEGPIYLRSSSHKLPDVVAALRGPPSQPIEIDLDGRVDSLNGGIRTTFETVPDLPVSKAIVSLQGGKKGLFQNSTNICKGAHRATVKLDGQNGKVHDTNPLVKAQCGGKGKGKG